MPDLDYRTFVDIETRTAADAPGFSGYAAHFNSVDAHGTAMAPGAFKRTIKGRAARIPVLWQHNPDWPVGRHLAIEEDGTGLRVDVAVIDDDAEGTVLLNRLRGGVPLSMSFGFQTKQDRTAKESDGLTLNGWNVDDVRVITEVKYWESSAVTFPSNEKATIDAVRSQQEADGLSLLLADLEAGLVLDEFREASVQRLVALAAQRPGPGGIHSDHSTRDEQAPHADDLDVIALTALTTRVRLSLSGAIPLMQTSREVKLREQLVTDLNTLQLIVDNPDRTADDNTNARNLQAQIETAEAELAEEVAIRRALERKGAHEAEIRLPVSSVTPKPEQPERRTSKLLDFATSPQVQAYRENPVGRTAAFPLGNIREERTLIYGGALAADQVRPTLVPGIWQPREPLGTMAVRDVLQSGQISGDSVTTVKENVFTNAAAPVAEAVSLVTGAKPESAITFTQVTDAAEVIAHGIPITRQAIEDVPQLQSYVSGRLLDGLRREENDQLLNGDGTAPNLSGILDRSGVQNLDQAYFTGAAVQNVGAGGPENFNRILRAKTLIMTTGDATASFLIANPTDWEVLITLADTTDQYFGMGPFDPAQSLRIWGLTVVLTEDKAAGSYVVGDGMQATVWDRWAAQVQLFEQHSDYAARNMFYLRAEERLALSVVNAAAFALVDAA